MHSASRSSPYAEVSTSAPCGSWSLPVSVYLVAYRYYSLYIAQKVMKLDPTRATPAVINNDGLNYVPTNRYVLFGHHFAAIAGAGPLVGPVLAAQMGYLPGTLWLLAGVVLAGAVQGLHGAVYLFPP
ncbi:carbon starvation protein [Citrobacter koseri]|uniref:Carbon starvation protein n=1 Tax=Citrobacter koseri TaxID=545 RepID=A0A2X2VBN7_CITKO|nr:carbon starvation protein [Citrobacter koseri]